MDITHPGVDAERGWQYAHHFSDPSDEWTAEMPSQLERLLTGNAVSNSLGSPSSLSGRTASRSSQTWVRRRRWVRVMRRRLDIPPLPFLQPDGSMYHLDAEGNLIPYIETAHVNLGDGDGQEMGAMPTSFLSTSHDYVSRARYLVGTQNSTPVTAVETRRAIAKLERATTELRQGILSELISNVNGVIQTYFRAT